MIYFLAPIATIFVIALLCATFKVGFIVSDMTEGTGFNVGFYMITVCGLLAAEISLAAFLIQKFTQ